MIRIIYSLAPSEKNSCMAKSRLQKLFLNFGCFLTTPKFLKKTNKFRENSYFCENQRDLNG